MKLERGDITATPVNTIEKLKKRYNLEKEGGGITEIPDPLTVDNLIVNLGASLTGNTTVDGDISCTGDISSTGSVSSTGDIYEGGTKLEDKYGGKYSSGDVETVVSTASGESYALIIGGLLTSATKGIYFSIQTPKSMAGLNPSITSLRINPRHSGGGYMIGSSYVSGGTQVVGASGYTITANKTDDYHITITIARSSAYNGTNNTPCIVQVDELIISFS